MNYVHKMEIENFEEHPILIGKFVQEYKQKNRFYNYPCYIFSDIESEHYEFIVPKYSNLKSRLSKVKPGQIVKMVFKGYKELSNGNKMKQFHVYIGK